MPLAVMTHDRVTAQNFAFSPKKPKELIQSHLTRIDLVDLLIDIDHYTNFLRHFLHAGGDSRLSPAARRRNALAALMAIGCNLGPQRMAIASGLSLQEISFVADWYLTEESLKAASIDIINFASQLPMSHLYGRGNTCSADGMRFYVPVNILAADYSHVLQGRGVTLYAHTADNCLRIHQQPIPCRLREAAFSLDGLLEHDTELDPKVCYTDTCSSLIPSGRRLDYIPQGQLGFGENRGAFRLTHPENQLGFGENSLITSDAAGII
jgi:Tn3 transposase DDE domain